MKSRAAKKYSSRRKAKYHRTDLPLIRPWIMDRVHSAHNRLSTVCDNMTRLQHGDDNTAGAGLCVITEKDALKGLRAYSDFLVRYSLHVSTELRLNLYMSVDCIRNVYGVFNTMLQLYFEWVLLCLCKRQERERFSLSLASIIDKLTAYS